MLVVSAIAFVVLCFLHEGTPLPRIAVMLAIVGLLSFVGWRDLRKPPFPPIEQKAATAEPKPQLSSKKSASSFVPASTQTPVPSTTISAPNGIAIGGGVVSNPQVNNYYAPPQRILTGEKNDKFIASLKETCPFEIVVRAIPGNAESMEYADQLSAAIKEAGCTVVAPRILFDTTAIKGLWVTIHDRNNIPKGSDALLKAFGDAGVPAYGRLQPDIVNPGEIYLMVTLNDTGKP